MANAPQTSGFQAPRIDTGSPETTLVETTRVWCDGSGDIRGGANYRPAALGHPRVYLEIGQAGYVDCGYCDRRFILAGGPAHKAGQADASGLAAA